MVSVLFHTILGVIGYCCGNNGQLYQRIAVALPFILIISLLSSPYTGYAAASKLPFWSSLTPFEEKVLRDADAARLGDPDTLLALALIASGDIRKQKSYDRIRNHILEFIKEIRPSIVRQHSVYGKGEKLLHAMHTRFFKGGKDESGPELISGYDADQSKVSSIFKSGRFNCISSSILFIVLARYFDLTVQGVITTEHAFIQIIGEAGRAIEVETTSKQGYGLVHDKTFFKENFARFSKSRNLSVPTYEDYLKRHVVLPYILITENMNHQHTAAARMKMDARQRLGEIRGYLDAISIPAQLARLNTYYNGCVGMFKHRDPREVEKMLRAFTPVERHIKGRPWIKKTREKDVAAVWARMAAVHIMLGNLRQSENAYDSAQHHYSNALQWSLTRKLRREAQKNYYALKAYGALKKAIQDYQKLIEVLGDSNPNQTQLAKENIAAAYWNMGNAAQKKRDWKTAAIHYGTIEKWSRDALMLKQSKAASARSRAMAHYERRQWAEAIRFFKEEVSYGDLETANLARNNLGAAYTHWGNELFTREAYEQALDKYEAALELIEPTPKISVYQNIASAYHNLAVALLNKRRTAEAMAILKSGINRFPECAECRNKFHKLSRQSKGVFR